jgi:hypothetical protein
MALSFNSEIFQGIINGNCVSGSVSGSFTGSISGFSGSLIGFDGCLSGYVSGSYDYSSSAYVSQNKRTLRRSLLKFDLTEVSKSVVAHDIINPKFVLNLKVTEAKALPLTYKIYCYPLSQSWEMGSGIYAFGGNNTGVNWVYRNYSDTASIWYPNIDVSYIPTDNYLETPSSSSFNMGGGVWHYIVPANYVTPSSSIKTEFFNLTASTFEQVFSSSLQTNLTASFTASLNSSINSVLSGALAVNSALSASYTFLSNFATTIYSDISASVSASLDISSSVEISASTCYLDSVSASLQESLYPSQFSSSFASSSYSYMLSISSSLSTASIYSDVYLILNQIASTNLTNSINALYEYNAYTSFYNDFYNTLTTSSVPCFTLTSSLSPCDSTYATEYARYLSTASLLNQLSAEYLGYATSDVAPYILTSSIAVIQTQFSSSIFNSFSSSFMYYFNESIQTTEETTYETVWSSSAHYYVSDYFSSVTSGSSLKCTQSFDYYQKSDVVLDVTRICKAWLANAIPNNGLILMISDEVSTGDTNGEINFYAKETNTIYTPYIDVQWDDSTFTTGNLLPVTSSVGVSVSIKNLKKEYRFGSIPRFNIYARDLYPKKSFSRLQTVYLETKYLPTSSYYAIADMESAENIVDFDEYTKLSCDDNSNYFMLDTTGLPQERYYKVLIKVVTDSETEVFDSNAIFKITR